MATNDLRFDQLLAWWEPRADIAFIFSFNWKTINQLREAITMFLSARLHALAFQASKKLTESGSRATKLLLASNPESPGELLDYLTVIGDTQIVVRVAENSSTSQRTLEKLSGHTCPAVRCAVADNTNTSEVCLLSLAQDEDADVRYCLAENPNLPINVLYVLLKDENPYVSLRATTTLNRRLSNTIESSPKQLKRTPAARLQAHPYDGIFAREVITEIQAMYDAYQAAELPECQPNS